MTAENNQEFIFYSEKLNYKTSVGNKGKEYFVEGYISTEDLDLVNDIVTKSCMGSMLNQFSNRTIKLDFEHETFRGSNKLDAEANKTRIPLGKAVKQDQDSKGVLVQWQMNPSWKKFDSKGDVVMTFKDIWDNVESGMYDAFSIAYVPTRTKTEEREGKSIRLLDDINLLNVALTGNAINPAATMTAVMAKSLEFLKNKEEINMEAVEIKNEPELKYKYVKRTGGPGNYTYTYPDGSTSKNPNKKKPIAGKEQHKEKIDKIASNLKKEYPEINYEFNKILTTDNGSVYAVFTSTDGTFETTKLVKQAKKIMSQSPTEKKSADELFARAQELNLSVAMADRFIKSNLSDNYVDKENKGKKQMETNEIKPEAKAENPDIPAEAGSEAVAEGSTEPEEKSMTLKELKSVVETLVKDVEKLTKENTDLKAIVEKPLQKAKGAENKEAKSQPSETFNGPMDLIA